MVMSLLYLNIDNDQRKNLFTKIAKGAITMGTIEIRYACIYPQKYVGLFAEKIK